MTPERWAEVRAVVEAALERTPSERAAYLAQACATDAELRREVESLLAAASDATPALGVPQARAADQRAVVAWLAHAPRRADEDEDDRVQRLRAALAGRYAIEHEIGRGGMATVYLARDLRHGRLVAVKALHAEFSAALGPERFLREIRVTAALQHPHILPLFDSGAADGLLYYVAPYVTGASLRERLRRAGRVDDVEALRLLREVADALTHAHRHGVVHRDIKPENILVDEDGHALVADFGIARAAHPVVAASAHGDAGATGAATLTQTGAAIGTPAYMSPEQAFGERALDGRSDEYSLACLAFELFTGERAFPGPSAEQLARRLTEPPPTLREHRPELPVAADTALRRALSVSPNDRFPTASAFVEALGDALTAQGPQHVTTWGTERSPSDSARAARAASRRRPSWRPTRTLAAVVALLAAVVTAAVLAREPLGRALGLTSASRAALATVAGAQVTRLAVLPFEHLGESPDDYIADGVAGEVRGKLAAVRALQVIARASSNEYRHTRKGPEQIARELDVPYLLTGTVRTVRGGVDRAPRVRVSLELLRVAPPNATVTLWRRMFDAEMADIFAVQADIVQRVAEALDLELKVGDQVRLAHRPTTNLPAYEAFLKGEQVATGSINEAPALLRAARYYERAVALDSGFDRAWARLSFVRSVLAFNHPAHPAAVRARAEARAAADRALALAPASAEGRAAMGMYYVGVEYDAARAVDQFALGLDVAPDDADLLTRAAWSEQALGRWEAALAHLRRATAVDPRSLDAVRWLGFTLLWLRRYPDARAALDRALALAPGDLTALQARAMVEIASGDLAGARAVLRHAPADVDPEALAAFMGRGWDLGWVLDEAGQRLLLSLGPEAFGGDRMAWALALAQVHAVRGDARWACTYADSARVAAETALRENPNDPQLHALYGLALAYVGRMDAAVEQGRRSVALLPITKDAYAGAYMQHQLVRIELMAGHPDAALDALEPLLRRPYHLSRGWLRVDPTFAPLRGHPRFERLVVGR